MIKELQDNNEIRDSGVIFRSTYEKIKDIFPHDPELAGELAISAIEQLLTGKISSDNYMIKALLQNEKVLNERNQEKHDNKVKANREKRMKDLNLKEIAEMYKQKITQANIAKKFGVSQQTISKRIGIIQTDYPELLEDFTTFTTKYNHNVNDNDNVNDNKGNIVLTHNIPNSDVVLNAQPHQSKFEMISGIVRSSTGPNGNFIM